MLDVAVIGGGAAGIAAAVMIKRLSPTLSVTVFEGADRVCKKLAVTGNGRCNITNRNPEKSRYHGDPELAERLLSQFGYEEQKEFFRSIGVPFLLEDEGKAYPMSLQAASVADALRYEAAELGIDIRLCCPIEGVAKKEGGFSVAFKGGRTDARAVIVACGGKAGGKLGHDSGYGILKSMGHKIEPLFPSLVQLRTEPQLVRQLKGIKVQGRVALSSSMGFRQEEGEILFADYGISGPPVLQVSRLAGGEGAVVSLDLMPNLSAEDIAEHLLFACKKYPGRPSGEIFAGFMHKRLGQVLLKHCGGNINAPAAELSAGLAKKFASAAKGLRLKVLGTTDFPNAQVTAGGAQTAQFFDSLMSKKAKGLFAVGEVLNVDGDCGGYNLAFCWASANAAAKGVVSYLEGGRC